MLNLTPSRMLATAKMVEGATSECPVLMASSSWSASALTPARTAQKRSVLAVHRTTTLSTPEEERKSRMSRRIWRMGETPISYSLNAAVPAVYVTAFQGSASKHVL